MQNALKSLLTLVNTDITLVYFVFDGAFGNNDALQMVRQCHLHLISKMRHDSALYLPYAGKYSGRGPRRKYGKKLNCRVVAKKYLKRSGGTPKILPMMAIFAPTFINVILGISCLPIC